MPALTSDAGVYNLEIQPGATLDLGTHTLTVEGSLVNNGILRQTQNVPGGITAHFLNIGNATGAQDKYYGVEISPDGAMNNTTVEVFGNKECTTTDPTDTVNRCFQINPSTPQTARLRFYYLNSEADRHKPGSVQVWHWENSSGWSNAGTVEQRSQVFPEYHWIEVSGVNAYSTYAISEKVGGPTAISLKQFSPGRGDAAAPILVLLFAIGFTVAGIAMVRHAHRERK